MHQGKVIALLLIGAMSACGAAPPRQDGTPNAAESPSGTTRVPVATKTGADLETEVAGALGPALRVLGVAGGDVNLDGRHDAVAVVEPSTPVSGDLGEGPARRVVILLRALDGGLMEAASNDKLVACARCGGTWGDPFAGVSAGEGSFTLATEGGSREHWSNEYVFAYDAGTRAWMLARASRRVTDTIDGRQVALELDPAKTGPVPFQHADPDALPGTVLD
jgi:hypothetical protein